MKAIALQFREFISNSVEEIGALSDCFSEVFHIDFDT